MNASRVSFFVGALLLPSCASTSTVFVGPTCATLSSDDDHARQLGKNSLVFDHAYDLPGRTRHVDVTYPSGKKETLNVVSDHQDAARVIAGCGVGACGSLVLASGLLSSNGVLADIEGGSLLAGGALLVLDGWRPDQATEMAPPDEAACHAATPEPPSVAVPLTPTPTPTPTP